MRGNFRALTAALALLCGSAMFCGSMTNPAQAASAALVAAAEKEGALNFYSSVQQNVSRPWVEGFEKKYPKIKVDHTFSPAGDLLTRIISENKAGKLQADITTGGSSMSALNRLNMLDSFIPDTVADYPATYKDKDGHWVATDLYFLSVGINTDLVKPQDAPKNLQDLLDPKWKGKMAWTNQMLQGGPLGFIANILSSMGQDKGMDYLKKLATQQVVNYPASQTGVLDQLAAGAFPVAIMMFDTQMQVVADKGAPVKFVPIEPVFGIMNTISVLKGSPHPNAAKLFVDYTMSEEGQRIIQKVGFIPSNPKVPPIPPTLRPDGGNFKVNFLTPDQLDAGTDDWKKIYGDLFK